MSAWNTDSSDALTLDGCSSPLPRPASIYIIPNPSVLKLSCLRHLRHHVDITTNAQRDTVIKAVIYMPFAAVWKHG